MMTPAISRPTRSPTVRTVCSGGTDALDPVSLEMAFCTWYLDASRAERDLGFSPRDPMDTLLDTVEDLRARGHEPERHAVSPWSASDEVPS